MQEAGLCLKEKKTAFWCEKITAAEKDGRIKKEDKIKHSVARIPLQEKNQAGESETLIVEVFYNPPHTIDLKNILMNESDNAD